MNNLTKILFEAFKNDPQFENYFWEIDPEQDGNYTTFGVFGEVLRDLLIGKIEDNEFLEKQCTFINQIILVKNLEWTNVIKSEVFSILDKTELIKLEMLLSVEAKDVLAVFIGTNNQQ